MLKKSTLAIYTFVYALLYTFCLYKNHGGAALPFFVGITLCFSYLYTKGLNLTWKKSNLFPIIIFALIGISDAITANEVIHWLNQFVLLIGLYCFFLSLVVEDAFKDMETALELYFSSILGAISKLWAPLKDFTTYRNEKKGTDSETAHSVKIVLLTSLCTLPVLVIVICLLTTADSVFERMFEFLFNIDIPLGSIIHIVFDIVLVFLFVYGLISHFMSFTKPQAKETIKINSLIATTISIMFDIVYLIFSIIQIFYLFIGNFSLPDNMSYAVYAREGFFQLLFVAILNLAFLVIATKKSLQNKVLSVTLTIFSACTLIMTASSAFRMILYIRYYYFTFLRIFVLWALLVITLGLIGIIIQIWKPNFKFMRYSLSVLAITYTLLCFFPMDYFIAKVNLSYSGEQSEFFIPYDGYTDYSYLFCNLSNDAALVLLNNADFLEQYPEYVQNVRDTKITARSFTISDCYAKSLVK